MDARRWVREWKARRAEAARWRVANWNAAMWGEPLAVARARSVNFETALAELRRRRGGVR